MPAIRKVVAITSKGQITWPKPMGRFLNLLDADIRTGQHLSGLPDELAKAMKASLRRTVDLNVDIKGDVTL